MRPGLTWLSLTLALNLALLAALVAKPELAPAGMRGVFQRSPGDAARTRTGRNDAPRSTSAGAPTPSPTTNLWSLLATDDLKTLVARARAAGFPPHLIRAMLEARLALAFNARVAAEMTRLGRTADLPYWKTDPINSPRSIGFFEIRGQLYRESTRQLRELLGDDFAASYGAAAGNESRYYGNISKAKLDLIQKINDDYSEMNMQVRAGMQDITLPEDAEKFALLEREKKADIAALLTPEELANYELRTSRITGTLRNTLTLLDSDEEEFRRIYAIYQAHEDKYFPPAGGANADFVELRREAQKQINEELKATLGADRYAEYFRASIPEFQQLSRLAQRENVPAEATVRAFALRDSVSKESNRIFDDATLSNDAKRSALQALAQSTRGQLTAILGPTAGANYAQAVNWITNVETGRAVNFNEVGTATFRRLPNAATPPPRY